MELKIKVLMVAVIITVFGGLRWCCRAHRDGEVYPDTLVILALVTGVILWDIYRLKPGSSLSLTSLSLQYLAQKLVLLFGTLVNLKLCKLSRDVQKHQNELLRKILTQNRETKLFKYLNMNDISNMHEFVARVPLSRYDAYKAFVDDIEIHGASDVLFPGKADYIAVTSGTSNGASKRFPKSSKLLKHMGMLIVAAQRNFLNVPRNNYLRKLLAVRFCPRFWLSKSGIKCGPISGLSGSLSLNNYVAPQELMQLTDEPTVLYLNVLFGLKEEEICNLFFSTSSMALMFFQAMERFWEQVCRDIERGEVSDDLSLPKDVRTSLNKHLSHGDPARAAFLRNVFLQGFKDIVPRIWPSCPALFCLATGSFAPQANIVKEQYLGDVSMISPFHAGTETMYGINFHIEDPDTTYVAMTTLNFFEFILVDDVHLENPKTYFAHEVEVGREYELVITTWDGLYRYRTEDLVLISGFLGTVPRYKFSRRCGDLLVCNTARVPEPLMTSAVISASRQWGVGVAAFTSTESIHVDNVQGRISQQQSFVVLLELDPGTAPLSEKQLSLVDEELISGHEIYARFRRHAHLGPVNVIQLRSDTLTSSTFRSLVNPNNTCMQYKLPRVVRRTALLTYLLQNRVKPLDPQLVPT